mgnify:FL=1
MFSLLQFTILNKRRGKHRIMKIVIFIVKECKTKLTKQNMKTSHSRLINRVEYSIIPKNLFLKLKFLGNINFIKINPFLFKF